MKISTSLKLKIQLTNSVSIELYSVKNKIDTQEHDFITYIKPEFVQNLKQVGIAALMALKSNFIDSKHTAIAYGLGTSSSYDKSAKQVLTNWETDNESIAVCWKPLSSLNVNSEPILQPLPDIYSSGDRLSISKSAMKTHKKLARSI